MAVFEQTRRSQQHKPWITPTVLIRAAAVIMIGAQLWLGRSMWQALHPTHHAPFPPPPKQMTRQQQSTTTSASHQAGPIDRRQQQSAITSASHQAGPIDRQGGDSSPQKLRGAKGNHFPDLDGSIRAAAAAEVAGRASERAGGRPGWAIEGQATVTGMVAAKVLQAGQPPWLDEAVRYSTGQLFFLAVPSTASSTTDHAALAMSKQAAAQATRAGGSTLRALELRAGCAGGEVAIASAAAAGAVGAVGARCGADVMELALNNSYRRKTHMDLGYQVRRPVSQSVRKLFRQSVSKSVSQ